MKPARRSRFFVYDGSGLFGRAVMFHRVHHVKKKFRLPGSNPLASSSDVANDVAFSTDVIPERSSDKDEGMPG